MNILISFCHFYMTVTLGYGRQNENQKITQRSELNQAAPVCENSFSAIKKNFFENA